MTRRLLVAALALALPNLARAESAELSQCIARAAGQLDFSGVVSVVQPASITTYALGRLNGPVSHDIGPETRFNLASAGKMFTIVAVAELLDAGKITLDDPIGRYVPGLTREAAAVTVRQLLTHSSGLGNYLTPENLPTIEKARSVSDLLPLVAADKPAFTPGARFQYSNTGFVLLGLLIERVSGQSYGDYLSSRIFTPAKMTASGLEPGPQTTRAVGMTAMPALPPEPRVGGGPGGPMRLAPGPAAGPAHGPLRPAPEAALYGSPAGGAYSTANDLRRFFVALLGGKLISPPMLEALISNQIVVAPASAGVPERDHGLGFGVGVFAGHRWFGHNGGAPGVNTETAVYPDDRSMVIVLSDRDPPTATDLFRRVREMVFDPAGCG